MSQAPQPPRALTPLEMRIKRLMPMALMVMSDGIVGLDQISKVHAQRELMVWTHQEDLDLYQGRRFPIWVGGDPVAAMTGQGNYISLNLNYVRNQGAAWGAMSNLNDKYRVPFFFLVTVLAMGMIVYYLRATPLSHRLARLALMMILGGAIGNFIDRIRLGYVIDWIDINWSLWGWRYYFPNFNVADSAITVGVVLLIWDMLVLETIRRRHAKQLGANPGSSATPGNPYLR